MAENSDNQQVSADAGNGPESVDGSSESSNRKIQIKSPAAFDRFKSWYASNKKISIPLTVLLLAAIWFAIPATRYTVAGLFIKKDISVTVTDSKTGGVVSSAQVDVDGRRAETNGQGRALVSNVPVGNHTLKITKENYKDSSSDITVGFGSNQTYSISTEATGRPAKVSVVNAVSKEPLSEVEISDGDVLAKTDNKGNSTLVLAVGTTSKTVTLSLKGYNDVKVEVKASDDKVLENSFAMSPSGKVYFLSKASGKIDLVKTNLDGTERKTVLAGTGKEDDGGTVLLASRDWKYLTLLSRRDGGLPKLYLIETENDKMTTMDEGNASFSLVGWQDSSFVYQVTRNTYSDWQAKKNVIKSFNADTKQLTALEQTDASGNSGMYIQEQFGNVNGLADGSIVYTKIWYNYPYGTDNQLEGKQNGIYSIRADGSGKKTLKTMSAKNTGYITTTPGKPNELYFYYYTNDTSEPTYLEYSDGSVSEIKENEYPSDGVYNTYLQSPNGKQTFWSEQRDGKSTLLVGDVSGNGGEVVAKLTDYQTYGWYTDDYLLVSKNSSELYVLPVNGLADGQEPLKVSDYHKPAQSYFGYGGGYGGI